MKIHNIIKKLYPFDYSIVGKGNDLAIKKFKKFLPFKIHNFKSGQEYNGWKIPNEWILNRGIIKDENKKIIFDAKNKKFGVPAYSVSFRGKVDGVDLKSKIYFSKTLKKATPYNWSGLYRFEKNFWGFCMNKEEYLKIKNKKYFVEISTKTKKSNMRVLEYTLPGSSNDTIIINAHNCHPYQANDDISGCAVGIKLFQELKKIKKRKFTYTLLIAPELVGPVFWLKKNKNKINNFKYAVLLKSVGNKNTIKLQHSSTGNSEIDNLAIKYLKNSKVKFNSGEFRSIYGNDEIIFDSPGYNIRTISLTRYPFKEYHTDFDTPERISNKHLNGSYNLLKNIIFDFEKHTRFKNLVKGTVALSNPKYNLYLKAYSPGIDKIKYTNNMRDWNLLMNNLTNYIDKNISLEQIARMHKLNLKLLFKYVQKWEEKKLIKQIK